MVIPEEEGVFGRRLRNLRILKGYSREQLAQELGLSKQQIHKMENGLNRISASRVQKIANLFKISVTCFYDLEVNPDNPTKVIDEKDAEALYRLGLITDKAVKQRIHELIYSIAKHY